MSIVVRYYAQGVTQIYLDLLELWAGRVAGALTEDDYTKKLAQTGFNQIGIETAWLYGLARERLSFWLGVVVDRLAKELADSATPKWPGLCARRYRFPRVVDGFLVPATRIRFSLFDAPLCCRRSKSEAENAIEHNP